MKIIVFAHAEKKDGEILDYRKLGYAVGRIIKELSQDLDTVLIIHSALSYSKLTMEFIADTIGLYKDGLDQYKIHLKRWLSNYDIVFQRLEKFIAKQPKTKIIIIVAQSQELLEILGGFNKKDKFKIWTWGESDGGGPMWNQGTSWLIDLEAKEITHLN